MGWESGAAKETSIIQDIRKEDGSVFEKNTGRQ